MKVIPMPAPDEDPDPWKRGGSKKVPDPNAQKKDGFETAGELARRCELARIIREASQRATADAGRESARPAVPQPRPPLTFSNLLTSLAGVDKRKAEVVTLWTTGRLTTTQIAKVLETTEKSVQLDLDLAMNWIAAATKRSA